MASNSRARTRRTAAMLGAGAFLLLGLTGCRSDNAGYDDEGWRSENIATPNGSVTCVLYDGYDGDSISCNWAGAAK